MLAAFLKLTKCLFPEVGMNVQGNIHNSFGNGCHDNIILCDDLIPTSKKILVLNETTGPTLPVYTVDKPLPMQRYQNVNLVYVPHRVEELK
jgi:hypothetical protein